VIIMTLKAKSTASEKATPAKRSKPTAKGGKGSGSAGGSGAQKIVSALALLKKVHQLEEAPKVRVAKMAGIPNATLPSLLSRLKSKGCIEYGVVSGTIKVTDKGMAEMVDPNLHFPSSNAEHHETIKAQMKGKARQVFEILMDGEIHDKQDIMEAIDCMNPTTFAPMMSRELKNFIHYPSKGLVQLHPDCFPFDREEYGAADV
jgi:hypothetical protein